MFMRSICLIGDLKIYFDHEHAVFFKTIDENQIIKNNCMVLVLLHDPDSINIIKRIKSIPFFQWLPVVIVSQSEISAADRVNYLTLGVDDVITEQEEIQLRIESIFNRSMDFFNQAFRDPLTGTFNRRYFHNYLEYKLERYKETNIPLSLAFLDLDHFKLINDTYGHDIGDLALQGMADLIQRKLAPTDLLARFGGEEYVLIMDTGLEEAKNRLNDILLECNTVPIVKENNIKVTFSSGVCEYNENMTSNEWIKLADEAAYKAKQRGRNRVVSVLRSYDHRKILLVGNIEKYQYITQFDRVDVHTIVADLDEITKMMDKHDYTIIVIDFEVTGMAGWEMIENIRKHGYDPIIVALSGKGLRQQFIMLCDYYEIKHYICRPFEQSKIKNIMSEILDEYK